MITKYNIYYSTKTTGPWTKANNTPIEHSQVGNSYQITDLQKGTTYFFIVVGGYIDDDTSEFVPLITQSLSSQDIPAKSLDAITFLSTISAREYITYKSINSTGLGHIFNVQ